MRLLGVALLGMIVSCGGGTPPVTPPPEPIPGKIFELVPVPKPMNCTGACNQTPKTGEFWVGKGKSATLTIKANQLSPVGKKVRLATSVSTSGLGVTITGGQCVFDNQGQCTLEGNKVAELTVSLDASAPDGVPYFFINGYSLDASGRTLDDFIRIDFRWNLSLPPATL